MNLCYLRYVTWLSSEFSMHSFLPLLPQPSLWVVAVQDITLKTYRCPNGYCIQMYNTSAGPNTHGSVYTYNSSEAQCNCNRSGMCVRACMFTMMCVQTFKCMKTCVLMDNYISLCVQLYLCTSVCVYIFSYVMHSCVYLSC